MTDYLTDGVIQVTILPEWNTALRGAVLRADSQTVGGKISMYKWGEYDAWSVPMRYVQNSDGQQINQWWETQQRLTFYYDSSSYDVFIIGNSRPFKGPTGVPYFYEYGGTVNLVEL